MIASPTPTVSVIVPNYNHARFLDRRLGSILGQSFGDFELLFLDDASTDDSLAVFEPYRGDPRVRAILNERNSGGPFPQWNRGVRAARGRYVWIAESDDEADPGLLETLLGPLEDDPRVVLSYCESLVVDERDDVLMTGAEMLEDVYRLTEFPGQSGDPWRRDFRRDGRELCRSTHLMINTVPNASAVVFRRDAYLAAGGAPEAMRICGDWLTWGRIMLRGDVAYTARPLNRFRTHAATCRSSTQADGVGVAELLAVVRLLAREAEVPHADRAVVARARGTLAWFGYLRDRSGAVPRSTKWRILREGLAMDPAIFLRPAALDLANHLRYWPPLRRMGRLVGRAGPHRRTPSGLPGAGSPPGSADA